MERVQLGSKEDGGRKEDFIQGLVHRHPSIIPMLDIEPAFTPLVSICRELPTDAGYLDNLWLTPEGGIVLGECKLMRNPQARREVVAQALDYARAISGWHYCDLEAAVNKARSASSCGIWNAVQSESSLEEAQFVDAIERRLRQGRFMILIIGDGIREGVEELADYMQLHAGLHTSIALVDLSIWQDHKGQQLVVPRIPAKTVLVERGIVRIEDDRSLKIHPPERSSTHKPSRSYAASEPEYFAQLEQNIPGAEADLRKLLIKIGEAGVEPEFQKSLVLRFFPSPDISASVGYIDIQGRVTHGDAWWSANKLGKAAVGQAFLEEVAALIGGSLKEYKSERAPLLLGSNGKSATLGDLLVVKSQWADAILRFLEKISDTEN